MDVDNASDINSDFEDFGREEGAIVENIDTIQNLAS